MYPGSPQTDANWEIPIRMPPTVKSSTYKLAARIFLAGSLLSMAICETGCSSAGAYQAFTYRKTGFKDASAKVLTFSYDPSDTARPFFKDQYNNSPNEDARKEIRNRIMYELMGMVDDYYFRYTFELRRDISSKGVLADTAGIATSLAATAVGANDIKTVLSAISTGVQGFSKSIDSNVLLGNTVQAIRLQMDATRADIATEIITNLKTESCTDYPLEAGLRDIIRYYDAGTLTSGLATLAKDAGTKKAVAEGTQTAVATNGQIQSALVQQNTLPALNGTYAGPIGGTLITVTPPAPVNPVIVVNTNRLRYDIAKLDDSGAKAMLDAGSHYAVLQPEFAALPQGDLAPRQYLFHLIDVASQKSASDELAAWRSIIPVRPAPTLTPAPSAMPGPSPAVSPFN